MEGDAVVEHHYELSVEWTGNDGEGTTNYRAYGRDHIVRGADKQPLAVSADPGFRGNPARYNPEELLVAALAGCHMLWYLHLCAEKGVVVTGYRDQPSGVLEHGPTGGSFQRVTLRPVVTVTTDDMVEAAGELHAEAHQLCFLARSVSFPVLHQASITVSVGVGPESSDQPSTR